MKWWRLAAAMLVVAGLSVGGPATLARASQAPWVPPSYGTGADVRDLVESGSVDVSQWAGGTATNEAAPPQSWYSGNNWCAMWATFSWINGKLYASEERSLGSGVSLVGSTQACAVKVGLMSWAAPTFAGQVQNKCGANWVNASLSYEYDSTNGKYRVIFNPCNGQVPPTEVRAATKSGTEASTGYSYYRVGWHVVMPTTVSIQLVCYANGVVHTEVGSASGASCASGTMVGGSVIVNGSAVGSWQPPQSDAGKVAACLENGCQPFVVLPSGECPIPVPGYPDWGALMNLSADCLDIREGQKPMPDDDDGKITCEWRQPPNGPVVPDPGPIKLTPEDCAEFIQKMVQPQSQPVDQDNFGPLKDAIVQVKRAVDAVRQAVESGFSKLQAALIGESVAPFPAPEPIPLPTTGPPAPGAADQMKEKFSPWVNALQGLIDAFNVPDPGCEGAGFWIPYPVNKTIHPFDACTEPWTTVARVFKAGLSVVLVVTGGIGCFRLLGAALGYHTGQGGEGGGES